MANELRKKMSKARMGKIFISFREEAFSGLGFVVTRFLDKHTLG